MTPERVAHMCRDLIEVGHPWTWTPDMVREHWRDFITRDGGFIKVHAEGDVLHIDLLAVEPARQQTGLGRRLMHIAEEIARVSGKSMLIFETDRPLGWFKRLGYRELGVMQGFYYGNDAIVMGKNI
jgi:GNAT superfamily N-acetyltransferase